MFSHKSQTKQKVNLDSKKTNIWQRNTTNSPVEHIFRSTLTEVNIEKCLQIFLAKRAAALCVCSTNQINKNKSVSDDVYLDALSKRFFTPVTWYCVNKVIETIAIINLNFRS